MRRRRAIVLVDTGFLIKALLIQVGAKSREGVDVNWTALADVISELAEQETGATVLRQTWYDASWGGRPRMDHRTLAGIPGVHVQLGWVVATSRGPQQKAVDTTIVRDLVVAASRGRLEEVVLIAGDGDLVPGLREIVDHGMRVHLWGVSLDDASVRQSEELVALADRRLTIDVAELCAHVRLKNVRPVEPEGAGAKMEGAAILPTAEQPPEFGATAVLPGSPDQPTDEPPAATDVLSPPSQTPAEQVRLGPPSLRQLTTSDQQSLDSLDDEEQALSSVQIGTRYGERWWTRADESTREDLLHTGWRPGLPRLIDGDLLKYAGGLGLTDRDDTQSRRDLRSGFWSAVDDQSAEEDALKGA